MIGPYTREKICNLNYHCNEDCNSSFECKFSRGMSLYINTCAHKYKGHVSSASQKTFWMFCIHTQNLHCNLSETSLEFTSGLEFEFVIVKFVILVAYTRAKNLSLELFFTGMIIQMTNFCPCVSPLSQSYFFSPNGFNLGRVDFPSLYNACSYVRRPISWINQELCLNETQKMVVCFVFLEFDGNWFAQFTCFVWDTVEPLYN